ncbi:hypothetical protein JXA27_06585 [Aerococcaceae bacterium zg-B36]|uniref:hypothetical protein n=1 Tax=Aerococcaceae bacterium zg-252 TaxID=2796928 RepID=UPI001BD90B6E|nr:hypothetical protein [Aerococcaceae bacterium zg-B36]
METVDEVLDTAENMLSEESVSEKLSDDIRDEEIGDLTSKGSHSMTREEIEQELSELAERMAQLEKMLEDRMKIGDTYFAITLNGSIVNYIWRNDERDNILQAIGNVFQTREDAEFEFEYRKVRSELSKFGKPFFKGEINYEIGYGWEVGEFIFYKSYSKIFASIYFESEETAKKAIDAVGADRVKRYYLRVEE